ncbi:hypothetical protein Flavo103_38210 [Flavobacterium collinsii]|jgi:hypothetical protein|uniref:hypothetical protein n=1 Tax=Flavobacterium collinsii TaxID=1114861 RepID=UPI0022C919B3|nr:hypothetical protein [Flavobacterium collinsii]GIQ60685.1 hypothetical protein Flavo103_38210 [Flavobacterium collinsii]
MLDKEKAETFGSVLNSGFEIGGASGFGAEAVSTFFEVSVPGTVVWGVSVFGVLTSTIEYPPFL